MQILTDSAADLVPEQFAGLPVTYTPLNLHLAGKTYQSGVDLQPAEFYAMLEQTQEFPTTSQPSAGDFAALYRRLAEVDPEILSIHVSSGLSGTLSSAQQGAALVPEARITFFDSMTLSCPLGWMVQAAGRAIQLGWSKERILEMLEGLRGRTQGLFTLNTLKYLVHGGRISHLKGLLASLLSIKPIIGPEKVRGIYATYAQERTMQRALQRFPDIVSQILPGLNRLRIQLLHGQNPEAVEALRQIMAQRFECHFEPVAVIAPVLGAHTGPSIIGLAAGDLEAFAGLV